MSEEILNVDVLIVGAGPAGLAAAIRLKQRCKATGKDLSVCVLEKGAEVGAHIISGAVIDPKALNELIPDWQTLYPDHTPVGEERFSYLTETKAHLLPLPNTMRNQGNFVVSLSKLCRFLGDYAQSLGVDIFPGFPAAGLLMENNTVIGIKTKPQGLDKHGEPTTQYIPATHIHGKHILIAEGARGSLSRQLIDHYNLTEGRCPQTYGLGIKEIWQVPRKESLAGRVKHTVGWPLKPDTYGGGFIYHLDAEHVAVGFVVGLDYANPNLSPFELFQQFKTHSNIRPFLEEGRRIGYGARALTEGGYQSIPKLTFPGGYLIGCAAGFMNVARLKGSHTAIKSGMLAAECVYEKLVEQQTPNFDERIAQSWIIEELYPVRNIRPGFKKGLWHGLLNAAFETYISHGKSPWTLKNTADHLSLNKALKLDKIIYPEPDNIITFDRLSSLALSGVHHRENQPCHLVLKNPATAILENYMIYNSPEQFYCPAGVYEIIADESIPRLQINAANCLHCKACDIKDPTQNIVWETPEGSGGPHYTDM
jgi:electron-transferring-flavoprotein dehydrogenase